MEGPPPSVASSVTGLLYTRSYRHHQHTAKRPNSARHRSKRARLQPRPRLSASMSPPPPDLDSFTGEPGNKGSHLQLADTSPTLEHRRSRRTTVQSGIQETILHPGNVRINVQGAFIVDEEQPGTPQSEDYQHDPQDIRLPNHTSVVSHVAVDVCTLNCRVFDQLRLAINASPPSFISDKEVTNSLAFYRSEAHSPNSYISQAKTGTTPLAVDSISSNSRRTE